MAQLLLPPTALVPGQLFFVVRCNELWQRLNLCVNPGDAVGTADLKEINYGKWKGNQ